MLDSITWLEASRRGGGIFCYESIKVVQYNYLIGRETYAGVPRYLIRGGDIFCYEFVYITVEHRGARKSI